MAVNDVVAALLGQNPNQPLATLTPENIKRQRELALKQMQAGADYSPVQSWTQGAARVAQALTGALMARDLDQKEAQGLADFWGKDFANATGGAGGAAATGAAAQASGGRPGGLPSFVATGGKMASAAPIGGFDQSVNRVLQFEGGYTPNDAGNGPTNYGISSAANPGVDVAKLTPDQAKQIYKSKYWDAIGGDELAAKNPALAHVAFDAAVNSGPARAQQWLQQSGGDPQKFMQLRSDFLQGLIASNPGKYQPYAKAWGQRIASLQADISGAAAQPGMAAPGQQGGAAQYARSVPGAQPQQVAQDLPSNQPAPAAVNGQRPPPGGYIARDSQGGLVMVDKDGNSILPTQASASAGGPVQVASADPSFVPAYNAPGGLATNPAIAAISAGQQPPRQDPSTGFNTPIGQDVYREGFSAPVDTRIPLGAAQPLTGAQKVAAALAGSDQGGNLPTMARGAATAPLDARGALLEALTAGASPSGAGGPPSPVVAALMDDKRPSNTNISRGSLREADRVTSVATNGDNPATISRGDARHPADAKLYGAANQFGGPGSGLAYGSANSERPEIPTYAPQYAPGQPGQQAGQPQAPQVTPQVAQRIQTVAAQPEVQALAQNYAQTPHGQQIAAAGAQPGSLGAIMRALANPYAPEGARAMLLMLAKQKIEAANPNYGFQTLPDGTILRTDPRNGSVTPIYQAPSKPTYGVIGKDQYGNEQYGWIDPFKHTVEAATPAGGAAPGTTAAGNVPGAQGSPIPAPPPGVDPKVWREQFSKREAENAVPPTSADASKLRGEIQGLPSYKNLSQAAPIYKGMLEAANRNSKASDLNLVYGLGKIMDPTSVVREGEMIMVKNTAGLPEWLVGAINSLNGGAALTPETRKAIMTEAYGRLQAYKGVFDTETSQYKRIAGRQRMNVDDIVPDFGDFPEYVPAPTPPTGPAAPAPAGGTITPEQAREELRRRGKL
ncbi:hypothetical protein SLNSH_22830 [Alsobacter soli]|uniref:TtsA-like Glycoside hydrolase family 108 domain-containing protein n=1 Tax=Alsobacter soli TaxID=2109933 RepID=A0A2T1HM97_9HYPH|nr:glycosyl hydrolase 108 family protein [Alsobacter soli]PSC02699.1 hypothetical protein SLNSH_22830 [Alsobacter soli]